MTEALEETEEKTEEQKSHHLSAEFIHEVIDELEEENWPRVRELIKPLHAADLAYLLDVIRADERAQLIEKLGDTLDPEVVTHLAPALREHVFDTMGVKASAAAISQLERDDAVDVIGDLEARGQEEILKALPAETRVELEEGLSYPESSAGRLMSKHFVSMPEYWRVGDAIDFLRQNENLPRDFYEIFVVDPKFRPVGGVLLSRIMRNQRDVMIRDIMQEDIRAVSTELDQEEVAHIFRKYGLVEAPVINGEGRIVGVITVDDVVSVIQEEAEEDIMRLGGVQEGDFYSAVWKTAKKRFPWLFINLLTAIVASVVIGLYEESIAQLVALAVLMPIVASMGGNAGTQTVTVAVRALATRELSDANAYRVIGKELLVGGVNGLLFAIVSAGVVYMWFDDVQLSMVFAAAMVVTLLIAGLSGALIPYSLNKLGADPAVASSVFLTTVTDVVGFLAFLGIAAWWLF